MLALRKTRPGVGNVHLEEVDTPAIAGNEVLMKVWAAGVCGSDLLIQDDKHFYSAPVTLGHEYSGVVVDTGRDVKRSRSAIGSSPTSRPGTAGSASPGTERTPP